MRHPHGLRAAAGNQGLVLPNIGDAFKGGFYAGLISHTADGVATHALIVAPRAVGASGSGYAISTNLAWQTLLSSTSPNNSFDGAANTALMINSPAADFCTGLSIGNYSDWYLPARDELDIAYYNLKPTTFSNSTSWGINDYSVPKRTANYTAGDPAQTSVSAFQDTGSEPFIAGNHWSSTQLTSTLAYRLSFADGNQFLSQPSISKSTLARVRAFRKIAV